MAEGHVIWQKCPDCDGTGVDPKFVGDQYGSGEVIDDTCPKCSGDKYLVWGWQSKDNFELPEFLPEIE